MSKNLLNQYDVRQFEAPVFKRTAPGVWRFGNVVQPEIFAVYRYDSGAWECERCGQFRPGVTTLCAHIQAIRKDTVKHGL